jgi:hypothetical protein
MAEHVAGVKNLKFERDPDLGDRGPCCAVRAANEMQGFLFARPAPAKVIDKLLVQAKQGGRPLAAADEALTA